MGKKSSLFRQMVKGEEPFIAIAGGVALHAKLAEAAGFPAFTISGANTCTHVLGLPDAGLITMTEVVQNTRRVCDVTSIPVMVDCDTGFGNAINVRRTVEAVIRAGAAGLFIEDQVAPKRCGFVKGKEILPLDEAVGKYRAAIDVRDELDPDFVIMSRTDARGAVGGGIEECINRLRAYKQAGVDVLYAEALQSWDEIKTVRAAVDGPFYATMQAIRPRPNMKDLKELGISWTSLHVSRAGLTACWDLLMAMQEHGLEAWNTYMDGAEHHPMAPFRVFDLVGFPQVREWEEMYLSPEKLAKYDQSIGLYEPGRTYR